jgi:hypothetical protein
LYLGADAVPPPNAKRAFDAIGGALNSPADGRGDRQALATDGLVALQRRILREPLTPGARDEPAALVIEICGAKQFGGDGTTLRRLRRLLSCLDRKREDCNDADDDQAPTRLCTAERFDRRRPTRSGAR